MKGWFAVAIVKQGRRKRDCRVPSGPLVAEVSWNDGRPFAECVGVYFAEREQVYYRCRGGGFEGMRVFHVRPAVRFGLYRFRVEGCASTYLEVRYETRGD